MNDWNGYCKDKLVDTGNPDRTCFDCVLEQKMI